MNKALTKSKWRELIRAEVVDEPVEVLSEGLPQVRVDNGQFMLGDDELGQTIQTIIVGWTFYNKYVEGTYSRTNPDSQSLECFALGSEESKLKPHAKAPSPHDANCELCEFNQFGTAEQGDGKRCSNRRRLALLNIDALEDSSEDPLFLFEVAPSGLKEWKRFLKTLKADYEGLHYFAVMVELEVDRKNSMRTAKFNILGEVEDMDLAEAILSLRDKAKELVTTPPFVGVASSGKAQEEEEEEEAPKPSRVKTRSAAAAKLAAAAKDEEDDEGEEEEQEEKEEEPPKVTRRRGRPAAKPQGKTAARAKKKEARVAKKASFSFGFGSRPE